MNNYNQMFQTYQYNVPQVLQTNGGKLCSQTSVQLSVNDAKLILEALMRLPVQGNKAILKKTLLPLKEAIERVESFQ